MLGEFHADHRELLFRLRELDLELCDVDALGLRRIDASPKKLQLLLELFVRTLQLVALRCHLGERGLRTGERSLQVCDTTE